MSLPAITLWANSNKSEFAADWQSNSTLPTLQFKQGDTIGIELHWVEHQIGAQMKEVIWPPAANITLAIGVLDAAPTAGSFRLGYDAVSTGDIAYNATAAEIQTALNALPGIIADGGVTVIKNGTTIRLSWNDPGVVSSSIVVAENNLTPTCSVGIGIARIGTPLVSHVVQLHVKQTPVAVCSSWTDSTAPVITVTEVHAPAYSGDLRIWRLVIAPEPRAGTFRLSKIINGTLYWSSPINISGLSDVSIAFALGLSVARISDFEYEISQPQIAMDALVNVSTIAADSSGLIAFSSKYGVLNLNSLDVELLLGGAASKTCICEIEVEMNGKYQTLVQSPCVIYNDLIDTDAYTLVEWGEVIPADSVVRYDTPQTLTAGEQAQARANIGAIAGGNLTSLSSKDIELEGRIANLEADHLSDDILAALNAAVAPDATNPFATDAEVATKAPLIHLHLASDISGLNDLLDAKANTSHTHIITNVTGLRAELDALALDKADAVHAHIIDDVSGLQAELDSKSVDGHTHIEMPTAAQKDAMDSAAFPPSATNPFLTEQSISSSGGLLTSQQKDALDNAIPSPTATNPVVTEDYLANNDIAAPTVQNNAGGYTNGGFDTIHYPKEIKVVVGGVTYAMPARIV